MKKLTKYKYLILTILFIVGLAFFLLVLRGNEDTWICNDGQWIKHGQPSTAMPSEGCDRKKEINSFIECVSTGNAVMESYPRQCRANGKTFVENIGNELEKIDLIRIDNPRPNEIIGNSFLIKGRARGSWFFEASFPIFLYDGNGQKIATTIAQAKDDWMTNDFVSFEAILKFPVPKTAEGTIIFKKDNPSGLSEHDNQLSMPIKFSQDTKKISLYFYNQIEDKKIAEYIPCSPDAVLPVEREIFLSQTPIQDSINLLLQGGITQEEKKVGFSSEFPLTGVSLTGANLKNGVLTLAFDDPLHKTSGGSCRVGLLWSEIVKTAKQFTEVKEVKFSPEDLFQP